MFTSPPMTTTSVQDSNNPVVPVCPPKGNASFEQSTWPAERVGSYRADGQVLAQAVTHEYELEADLPSQTHYKVGK